jgi:hypothetical protein
MKTNNLHDDIMAIMTTYTEEICEKIENKAAELAKQAQAELKAISPRSKGEGTMGKNDSKPYHYADKWKLTKLGGIRKARYFRFVIHQNSPKYRLTHLLEYGHLARDGSRVKAIPHIEPVQEKVSREFEKACEDIVKNS